MTREKAIKELQYVKERTGYADEALSMAIRVFQQEPCEDAISRAEVNAIIDEIIAENEAHEARIDWHDNEAPRKYETPERCERVNPNNPAKNTAMKYGYIADGAEKVKKRIANLSSVTPIRLKGKWVDRYGDGDMHCSQCNAIIEKDELDNHNWYYCYHCGARMED